MFVIGYNHQEFKVGVRHCKSDLKKKNYNDKSFREITRRSLRLQLYLHLLQDGYNISP